MSARRLEDMNEQELAVLMRSIAGEIEAVCRHYLDEKPRFALVLFNDPKIAQYIGNCRREDIIKSMRETADRLERNQDVRREG